MALDYVAALDDDGARVVSALRADRGAAIPWCDPWTVQDCAQHVGAVHHVVSQVIAGRPSADFGLFADLERPQPADPALDEWCVAGRAALLEQLRTVDGREQAWTWWPADQTIGFWARRMAHETLVHRWDAERGAGIDIVPADPALAADGVDEFLEIFAPTTRMMQGAPAASETAHLHCTDADGEWTIAFPAAGALDVRREHRAATSRCADRPSRFCCSSGAASTPRPRASRSSATRRS